MTVECEMVSYDEDTEIMVGKIINVSAEETILTDGKIDRTKLDPIAVDLEERTAFYGYLEGIYEEMG